MSKKPKSEYTGTWVPAHIMDDEFLTSSGKLLYALIASFNTCYASNTWLAHKLGITVRHAQRGIADLEDKGYIARSGEGDARVLIALRDDPRHLGHGGDDINVMGGVTSTSPNNIDNNKDEKIAAEPSDLVDGQNVSPQAGEPGTGPRTAPAPRPVLEDIIQIVNPREKVTTDRLKNISARLKEYTVEEITAAAKAFSKSTWHRENNQMSIDNLIRASKFGRWYAEGAENLQSTNTQPSKSALEIAEAAGQKRKWGF
jgi:Helix-turn-helix domain